jgi:hypothetical protein
MGLVGIIGLLAFPLCQGLSYSGIRMISIQTRFPLGEIVDMAVDKNDNIIVYLRNHCRLQIYRNNGELLRGWFVYTLGMTAKTHIDSNDRINLATRKNKHYVFDTDGNLLKEHYQDGIFENFCQMDTTEKAQDSKNNVYRVFQSFFRTHISKIIPEGSETIIISDPFYVWLFRILFPSLFLCIFSLFILICFGPRYGMFPDNRLSNFLKKKLLLKDMRAR